MRGFRPVLGAFVMLAVAGPCAAHAQDAEAELAPAPAPSDDAIRSAIELAATGRARYEAGDVTGAIAAYEQAFDLSRDPAFAYNLGALYEAVGEVPRARAFLAAYLDLYPQAPNRAAIAAAVDRLDQVLLAEWAQVRIDVPNLVADVLEVRGEREFLVGRTPFVRWVGPGARTYRVRATGYLTRSFTLEAAIGEPVDRTLTLAPSEHRLRRILQRCERGADLELCADPE